ncbi:DUF3332 domain-containing protein [Geomesophilobacter sediminis]|uniref:DUF3332 family protein n=1 Tax=Geomesophilobacter sediminis TaxID=2798584 RepID=A0A8J7JB09_9BACT|nr:DUF3332 domain-containing protein [Geomesophilobacter sediminis]MBJ6724221.1 DUF3332 family protein [Geomesophilobacter sediminis]
MKRIISAVLAMAVALTSLQGCYGKMALTRKVYRINGEVQNKYLRSLVSWVFIIVPVYGVSALVDFIVFNTIEFWSGSNPIGATEKDFQYAENGERFQIKARKSGDVVTYVIDHYRGSTYLDTMAINWNVKNGNSAATMSQAGKVTEFQATLKKGGVEVASSSEVAGSRVPETVAFYK